MAECWFLGPMQKMQYAARRLIIFLLKSCQLRFNKINFGEKHEQHENCFKPFAKINIKDKIVQFLQFYSTIFFIF